MSIMSEAHEKMRLLGESNESFKKRFTTERSRQFDFLESEEVAFRKADGCCERSGTFSKPDYQLKPSDGRNLNYTITTHKNVLNHLNDLTEQLTSHDATLFHPNGRTLKEGTQFLHDFNLEHIKNIELKYLKLTNEVQTLEEKMQDFNRIFKGIKGKYLSDGRRKKENRRKAKSRRRKRLDSNIKRVYNICVQNPLERELPRCLVYPPFVLVPEACINVEDVSALLTCRDAPSISHLIRENCFANAGASRLLTNLDPRVRDSVYGYLYPEEYSMGPTEVKEVEMDSGSDREEGDSVDEDEIDDDEEEEEDDISSQDSE